MGMRTTLYGYIEEMDFWQSPVSNRVKRHNQKMIKSLKLGDQWPPLSREMFSICHNLEKQSGPNLEYGGRVIHFGANLKSVEYELKEWISKFEALLAQLLWRHAKAHFKTEYDDLQTLSWEVDLNKYTVRHDGEFPAPINKSQWVFASTWPVDE